MYIEIDKLNNKELEVLQTQFVDRIRAFDSIYTEICKIEIECNLDANDISSEKYTEEDVQVMAEELGYRCENTVFQEICEVANEIVNNFK